MIRDTERNGMRVYVASLSSILLMTLLAAPGCGGEDLDDPERAMMGGSATFQGCTRFYWDGFSVASESDDTAICVMYDTCWLYNRAKNIGWRVGTNTRTWQMPLETPGQYGFLKLTSMKPTGFSDVFSYEWSTGPSKDQATMQEKGYGTLAFYSLNGGMSANISFCSPDQNLRNTDRDSIRSCKKTNGRTFAIMVEQGTHMNFGCGFYGEQGQKSLDLGTLQLSLQANGIAPSFPGLQLKMKELVSYKWLFGKQEKMTTHIVEPIKVTAVAN
jgi:hypothetical protein